MRKPVLPVDELARAIAAVQADIVPRMEDLRPSWFSVQDWSAKTGQALRTSHSMLNGPRFERRKAIINGRVGWAYRLKD